MASITIRNLDDDVKQGLRLRAARHGRSMEAEVRDILQRAVEAPTPPGNLGKAIHRRFASQGGVDLDLLNRGRVRGAPSFD